MKRITISVPDEIAEKASRSVEGGLVESISAYFVALAEREPDWSLAAEAIRELLAESGEPSSEDTAWVTEVLGEDADVSDAA